MNGYFQLDLRDEGTFLRVYPPQDGGIPVNINEVMEYLQKKGISVDITYLNQQIAKVLSQAVSFPIDKVKRYQERELMVPTVNWNKMEASARFYPP